MRPSVASRVSTRASSSSHGPSGTGPGAAAGAARSSWNRWEASRLRSRQLLPSVGIAVTRWVRVAVTPGIVARRSAMNRASSSRVGAWADTTRSRPPAVSFTFSARGSAAMAWATCGPAPARAYVERLSALVGCEIGIISTGADRAHTILRARSAVASWFD